MNISNIIQDRVTDTIVQNYEDNCCSSRICELAASISSVALAIIVTILAFSCANFFAAAIIVGAVWFIAMGGNLLTCCSCFSNLFPNDAPSLSTGHRHINVVPTSPFNSFSIPVVTSTSNHHRTNTTGAPILQHNLGQRAVVENNQNTIRVTGAPINRAAMLLATQQQRAIVNEDNNS